MKIHTTLNRLKAAEACVGRYAHLVEALGGVRYDHDEPIDALDILRHNGVADVEWLLDSTACIEDSAPAWEEYGRVKAVAWEQYRRVAAAAWEEYERLEAPAREKYRRVTVPAWEEYERVTAPAREQYRRMKAAAWEEILK